MTRYEDTERTFAALPPAQGRGFARTWWGRAWLRALEDAAMDASQVKTGRRLARAGAVGAVSVRPGRITSVVQDRDGTAHRADVLLERLSDAQWDHFVDMAIERSGHVAALLDRDMPPHLVEDAATAGIDLLPGLGDLEPRCECGAWDHCGHTAALCYQVAGLLDQDPFVLLLMRGRAEDAVLDALQTRGPAPAADGVSRPEGVDAAEAYAAGHVLPPPPAPPVLGDGPGVPPSLDTETAPPPGVDPSAVAFVASRAAAEAHRLLAEALREGHDRQPVDTEPTRAQDAARLAAGGPGPDVLDRLAKGSGRTREALTASARAWRLGGRSALSVLEDEWPVEGDTLARARAALRSAWDEDERPSLQAHGNRWTVVGAPRQLRLDREGRWWPYREDGGRWVPAGGPARDPATALASMTLATGDEL
ncbi:SWF or SNF family helicase [Streptomyces olivaceus]|uniref:SWF or SNF family helicase n=1 Tax=Streptomyces olivaceus TaxID=47716 RepID=A0ABS7W9G1_STROV|nr:SWF or SNF family helicase [Streptomyces olivaceus]MBZ6091668.1 SWF or SNF family helicase [Streptomyces olivaceus]MBZ6097898.1 SWF or SNF family helicase [Streptomyces olivaceus]MBZ6118435.1 SWF or SNF family helicase [Streptomyces olivaceus]MBZ6154168.1 SWF or SNF family helicase [Streptomyces olivaceus]MBZ6196152.1 SWF or SNF family helicase [Streptomyces olivaceus]